MSRQIDLPTLLVVADNPSIKFWVKKHLDERFFIIGAESRSQAMSALNAKIDFIIVDAGLETADPLELCKELSRATQKWLTPIWLITGKLKKSFRDEAVESGVSNFLSDQLDLEELEALIEMGRKIASSRQKTDSFARSIKMPTPVANGSLKHKFVLNDQAVKALAAAKAEKTPIALLLMRIDGLDEMEKKKETLSNFSKFINQLLRPKDLLIPASDGGFILLLSNTTMANARIIAERLQSKIQGHSFTVGHLTASIVVTSFDASEQGFTRMIDTASKSLKTRSETNLIITLDDEAT